jgi:hypothetical protein
MGSAIAKANESSSATIGAPGRFIMVRFLFSVVSFRSPCAEQDNEPPLSSQERTCR